LPWRYGGDCRELQSGPPHQRWPVEQLQKLFGGCLKGTAEEAQDMKLTGLSIGNYKPVIVNGKVKLVAKPKRYDVSTELKRKHSPKVKFKRGGK
jgi:hypothetical protein